jgi:hypothetical protein
MLTGPASDQVLSQLRSRNSLRLIGIDPVRGSQELLPGWKPFPLTIIQNDVGVAVQMIPKNSVGPSSAGG